MTSQQTSKISDLSTETLCDLYELYEFCEREGLRDLLQMQFQSAPQPKPKQATFDADQGLLESEHGFAF